MGGPRDEHLQLTGHGHTVLPRGCTTVHAQETPAPLSHPSAPATCEPGQGEIGRHGFDPHFLIACESGHACVCQPLLKTACSRPFPFFRWAASPLGYRNFLHIPIKLFLLQNTPFHLFAPCRRPTLT